MSRSDVRIKIQLRSTESPHVIRTTKSKRNDPDRLELRKYDPRVRRHVLFRETK